MSPGLHDRLMQTTTFIYIFSLLKYLPTNLFTQFFTTNVTVVHIHKQRRVCRRLHSKAGVYVLNFISPKAYSSLLCRRQYRSIFFSLLGTGSCFRNTWKQIQSNKKKQIFKLKS